MKLKKFAVIWRLKAMPEYGVPTKERIISVEPREPIKIDISKSKKGHPKIRYTHPLAIFDSRDEAEAYWEGNSDWEVVEITIISV